MGAWDDIDEWTRTWEYADYAMTTKNGRKIQKCIAALFIDDQDLLALKDKPIAVTLYGNFYQSADAKTPLAGIEKSFTFTIDSEQTNEVKLEPEEARITIDEAFLSENSGELDAKAATGVDGKIMQNVEMGFKTTPVTDDKGVAENDMLYMKFQFDAPMDSLPFGASLFQYLTYRKKGADMKTAKTVGCYNKVGDPYVSLVYTWAGQNSMGHNSKAVRGKTVKNQNSSQKASKKESFGLSQKAEWYMETSSALIGADLNVMQPCVAQIDLGKKVAAGDDYLGDYEVWIGARIYADDIATTYKSTPEWTKTFTLAAPMTDPKAKFEEAVVPEFSKEEIVNEKFFAYAKDVFVKNKGTFKDKVIDADLRIYNYIKGGFKLYGTADAKDRWYFNMAIDLPTGILADGNIVFQWVSWQKKVSPTHFGALGCQVKVGDTKAIVAQQWHGKVDDKGKRQPNVNLFCDNNS